MLPTVSLLFDTYVSTFTNAQPILAARGLAGTFFADPSTIGVAGGPSIAQLKAWQSGGGEIGVYSCVNVPNLLATSGVVATKNKLLSLKSAMAEKGFNVTSLAANQRAWSLPCRNLAAGIFQRVRVASQVTTPFTAQALPAPDLLYVSGGGTASLSSTDTAASLSAQLDLLKASGGLWNCIVHETGVDSNPPYSVSVPVLTAFCTQLAAEVAAGTISVAPFGAVF